MSSTNRSCARDSHKYDYYVTPINKITGFLKEFTKQEPSVLNGNICDPSAGGANFQSMSYPVALQDMGADTSKIDTIDIRKDSLAKVKTDYLTYQCKDKYDLIITNPPFTYAQEFVTKAIEDVKENGWVVMLLRLSFLESKTRHDFWHCNMPKYIFVHSERISFTGDGKTDSVAYAHFCWKKGSYPEFSKIKVI